MTNATKQTTTTKKPYIAIGLEEIEKPKNAKKTKKSKKASSHTTEPTNIINPNNSTPLAAKKSPCYIPLSLASQCGYEQVLYYNANAPADELYKCAIERINAVLHLLEPFYKYHKNEADALYAVSSISALLLNDALCLLEEFNPIALSLRNANAAL